MCCGGDIVAFVTDVCMVVPDAYIQESVPSQLPHYSLVLCSYIMHLFGEDALTFCGDGFGGQDNDCLVQSGLLYVVNRAILIAAFNLIGYWLY